MTRITHFDGRRGVGFYRGLSVCLSVCFTVRYLKKNSSGDEIANVLVNDDIAHT